MSKYIGDKFGNLTVIGFTTERTAGGNPKAVFKVRCDCGAVYCRTVTSVLYSKSKSPQMCRTCVKHKNAEKSARGYKHPLYKIWWAMNLRCYDKTTEHFHRYGGRGIKVCDRWRGSMPNGETIASIDGFTNFVVDMGNRPPKHSIDRVDNDGDYSPDNCRWATKTQQANNTSTNVYITYNGTTMTISDWTRALSLDTPCWYYNAIKYGIDIGWAIDTLSKHRTRPVRKWKKLYGMVAD